jgi:hypothetical protein
MSEELRDYLQDELEETGYCRICHNTRAYGDLGLPCHFCQPEAADKAAKYIVIPGMVLCGLGIIAIVVFAIMSLP